MEPNPNAHLHPLENPLILEKIFENTSDEDLLSCRLVSKLWCQETARAMRNAASVTIELDEDAENLFWFLEDLDYERSNFFRHPFVSTFYQISDDTDDDVYFYNRPVDCPFFWQFCGWTICDLKLDNVSFESTESFMSAIVRCCPNLKYLHLKKCIIRGEPRSEPSQSQWVPLQFPDNRNLKELEIDNIFSESFSWMELFSHFPSVEVT